MANHDPSRRAEAAVGKWTTGRPDSADLRAAAHGYKKPGGAWKAVEGPYLRRVAQRDRRNKTGVPGISEGTQRRKRISGGFIVRTYFFVQLGRRKGAKFCIESLGRKEAWLRALRCRAEHEMKVRRANAAILAAREANKEAAPC